MFEKWWHGGGADHIWHHPSASPAVIAWKVVGQHLFLKHNPQQFHGRKVWRDLGLSLNVKSLGFSLCESVCGSNCGFWECGNCRPIRWSQVQERCRRPRKEAHCECPWHMSRIWVFDKIKRRMEGDEFWTWTRYVAIPCGLECLKWLNVMPSCREIGISERF